MSLAIRPTMTRWIVVVGLVLSALSCEQYEYLSPDPGVIEVRLKVLNSRQDLLPFSPSDSIDQNILFITLNMLEAVQPEDVRLPIYSDLIAVRRDPEGDLFNCLDTRGRDSLFILGMAYTPPQTFTGLELTIDSPDFVFIDYGFYGSFIPVTLVQPYYATQELSRNIPVESGHTTRVIVVFDLDQSLIQLTETFLFTPIFYISSVEIL